MLFTVGCCFFLAFAWPLSTWNHFWICVLRDHLDSHIHSDRLMMWMEFRKEYQNYKACDTVNLTLFFQASSVSKGFGWHFTNLDYCYVRMLFSSIFAKWIVTSRLIISVKPSARNRSTQTGRIFVAFHICFFFFYKN